MGLYKHGLGGHGKKANPTYKTWCHMVERCYNVRCKSYPDYGGRGIRMCESLRVSVVNLVASIGIKPQGLSIDRINNDGNYSCGVCSECVSKEWPKNIRWATALIQNRNQRDLNWLTINGERKCLSEWADIRGLNKMLVICRYHRGWRGEKLLLPAFPIGKKH